MKGFCALREKGEKKGGGIQILMPKMKEIKFNKNKNKNKELLEIEGSIFGTKLKIIIAYFDANKNEEGKKRNKILRKDIEKIIEKNENEGLIIAGDFNGHLRAIDGRDDDINGRMLMEWVDEQGMIMLNLDEKCEGKYTRIRGDQRTTVDYIMVNRKIYSIFEGMKIDEKKEIIENSDHVFISMKMRATNNQSGFKKPKWITKKYLSDKEKDIEELVDEIENKWEENYPKQTQKLMEEVERITYKKLEKTIRRREGTEKGHRVIENIWMTNEIRDEIKKRKELNRRKRNCVDERKEELEKQYLNKKYTVQKLIRDAKYKYEVKITNEIKNDKKGEKMGTYT